RRDIQDIGEQRLEIRRRPVASAVVGPHAVGALKVGSPLVQPFTTDMRAMASVQVVRRPVVVADGILDLAVALWRIRMCLPDCEATERQARRALSLGPGWERCVGGVIRKERCWKRLKEEVVIANFDLVDSPVAEYLRQRAIEFIAWPCRRFR